MDLDEEHKSKLKHILEGAGERVSDSLSMMIDQPVETEIINLHSNTFEFRSEKGEKDDVVVYSELEEGKKGFALFAMNRESAKRLSNVLLMRDKDHEIEDFNEDEIDALTEAGNIVIGNFLSPVADHFNTDIMFDPPKVLYQEEKDVYAKFVGDPERSKDESDKRSLIADIRLYAKNVGIDGRYILIPSEMLTDKFIDFFES